MRGCVRACVRACVKHHVSQIGSIVERTSGLMVVSNSLSRLHRAGTFSGNTLTFHLLKSFDIRARMYSATLSIQATISTVGYEENLTGRFRKTYDVIYAFTFTL